jgi:hypothetical protein
LPVSGYRESKESWSGVLRGFKGPLSEARQIDDCRWASGENGRHLASSIPKGKSSGVGITRSKMSLTASLRGYEPSPSGTAQQRHSSIAHTRQCFSVFTLGRHISMLSRNRGQKRGQGLPLDGFLHAYWQDAG